MAPRQPGRRKPADAPNRLRPLRTTQEVAREPGATLVGIDNPDDADVYPPTETPDRGRRRRQDLPPRREG